MPLNIQFVADQVKIHTGPGFPFFNILRPNYLFRPLFTGNPPLYNDPATPTAWQATHAYTVGQTVLDTNNNVQMCTTAGTSGGTAPAWSSVVGGTTTDSTVTWTNTGPAWIWAATTAVQTNQQVRDSNNNIQQVVVAGTTGGTTPTWSTVFGAITTDGSVSWMNFGPTLASGAVTGDAMFDAEATTIEIDADQYTAPLDRRVTQEKAKITMTLRELNLAVAKLAVPNAAYTSGTDTTYPAGAQSYEEIGVGGILSVPAPCVCLVSPRPAFSNPWRNVLGWLNRCAPAKGGSWPFSLRKIADLKVELDGMAVTYMPAGYQIGRLVRFI
jgi:hypothetical protein